MSGGNDRELARELGVADLLFAQIIMIVGGTWVGTAGKLGPSHAIYWLLASVLFFVPLVTVVIFLNRWAPLEGGLYQWAKLAIGERAGFLVAFNLWLWAVVLMSSLGLEIVAAFAYAFPRFGFMHGSTAIAGLASIGTVALLAVATALGMRVGKRVHNAGGIVRMGIYALLLALPLVWLALGKPLRAEAARIDAPAPTLFSLNILAKMGFGAFSGFEYVAIFAGESRDPARSFRRSVVIAGPIVIAMFVLGTASVLAIVPIDSIDLIAPIPQVLEAGTRDLDRAQWLATAASALLIVSMLSWGSATFAGITRLPMVAGWDGLLPAWFTRMGARRVPVNSILFVAAVTTAFAIAGLWGVGHQEAYQLLASAALIFYAITYLVMFAIPIVGRGERMPVAPIALRIGAAVGFAMTLLFVVLALFPIVHVDSRLAFGLKVGGTVVVAEVIGLALYDLGRRRARR